jgi:hypothetical protein
METSSWHQALTITIEKFFVNYTFYPEATQTLLLDNSQKTSTLY